MTYFKYAEKNANSRINWADVGADMSAMISEEARVREEKKSAIDKDIREFRQVLFDSPIGENKGFNEFTSDFSSDAQEYSLVVEKLFRTGQMNQREYNTIKANLKQGTSEAFTIAEEYNAHYKLARERGEIDPQTGHPTSQSYEGWVLNGTLGFMNYSDNRLWINPVNGMVSMGGSTLNSETGQREMNTDIGSYESVNALRNRTQAQYNYFDMDSSNSKMVKQLGDVIAVEMKKNVSTREDATKSPKVMEAIDNHASATLALPTNISSVLTNSININPNTGNAFTFTSDPLEAARNPDLILSIPNPIQQGSGIPSPAFLGSGEALTKYLNENFKDLSYKDDKGETVSHSEVVAQIVANNTEQYDVAKDVVTTSMVSMLNKKETPMTQFDPRRYEWNAAKLGAEAAEEAQAEAVALWSEIWYLEPEKKQTALDAILTTKLAVGRSLQSITIDGNQLHFKYSGKNAKMDHSVTIPAEPTREDWIRLGGQIYDINKATVADGKWKDTDEYTGFEETVIGEDGAEVIQSKKYEVKRAGDPVVVDKVAQTRALISASIDADWFDDKDDVEMIPNFMASLRSLGITVKNQGVGGNNLVFTSGTDKTGIVLNTNNNSADAKTARENLLAWVRLQVSKDNAEIYMSSKGGVDYSNK